MEGASGESGGERRATTVAPARRRGVGTVERRAAEGRGGDGDHGGGGSTRSRVCSNEWWAVSLVQSPAGSIVKAEGKNRRKKFANSLDAASCYESSLTTFDAISENRAAGSYSGDESVIIDKSSFYVT
jgi:hypothetical protein